jgi:hypothetical protein
MKPFIALLAILLAFSCSSGHKATGATPAPAVLGLPDSSRDGSSFEKAIVIHETSETPGVRAEYQWIRDHEPGYSSTKQSLSMYKGKSYDVLHIKNGDGLEKDVYFDISNFFGKF